MRPTLPAHSCHSPTGQDAAAAARIADFGKCRGISGCPDDRSAGQCEFSLHLRQCPQSFTSQFIKHRHFVTGNTFVFLTTP